MTETVEAQQILRDALRGKDHEDIPERFWEVVERYRAELVHQALAITGNLANAEEVVQETFCEVFKQTAKLAAVRSVGAWLRSINKANALNCIRDERTRRKHTDRQHHQNTRPSVTTGGFSAVELQEVIARSVENLPPKSRSVVVLRYMEHRSYQEISETLGMPEGTVGRILCEALMHLHNELGFLCETGPEPERNAGTENQRETRDDRNAGMRIADAASRGLYRRNAVGRGA